MALKEGATLAGVSQKEERGGGKSENKESRSERGDADRFKSDCPIWLAKARKWQQVQGENGAKRRKKFRQ